MTPAQAEAFIEALDDYLDAKVAAAAIDADDIPPSRRYMVTEFERVAEMRKALIHSLMEKR